MWLYEGLRLYEVQHLSRGAKRRIRSQFGKEVDPWSNFADNNDKIG